MVDKLTTSSQHITSLDLNITPALSSIETLEAKFNRSMREIQAKANMSINFGKINSRGAIGQVADEMREMTTLESQFRRRMGWFFTGTLFYGTIAGARQAVTAMRDVETAVMKIGRVMEDVTFQTGAYKEELLDLASEYGQDFDVAADIALQFAQAGYNVKDSLDLTRTSLLAVNSAELDVQNATSSMIGIMAQWNLTAADMPLVLDKINKTGDDFTVTSQDLVDGLLRSSQAAQVMGMSIDETIATLTVMREASGRTGREVGNALNSILSYIQRPIAIKTLEGLGISMFTDQAKTQFRNFQDIVADIAAKMPEHGAEINKAFVDAAGGIENMSEELKAAIGTEEEWTDIQQRDIAQSAAGVYRRNYFIALLQRQARIQDVLNGMTNAGGYSVSENARYMSTLEAQVKTFNAEVLRLVTTLGDAGALDFTKDLVNLGTDGAKALDGLVESMGAIPPALATIMGLLPLFSKQMQIFSVNANVAPGTSVVGRINANELSSLSRGLSKVTSEYREIMTASYGLPGLTNPAAWQKASTAVTAFSRSLNIAGATAKVLGFALNMAVNVIAGLAIGLAVQKIYELVNAQKEAAAEAKATAAEIYQQQDAIKDLQQQYVDLIKSSKNDADSKKELIRIERQLKELLGGTSDEIDLQNKSLEENIDLVNKSNQAKLESYKIARQEAYEKAKDFLADTKKTNIESGYEGTDLEFTGNKEQQLEQMKKSWDDYNNAVQESNNSDTKSIIIRGKLADSISILEKKVNDAKIEVANYNDVVGPSIDIMKEQSNAASSVVNAYTALTDEEYKSVDALGKELDTLASTYNTLANGQDISASQMLDLIRNYDDIAEYVLQTNDLTLDSGKIAEKVFEVKKKAMIAEVETLRSGVNAKIAQYERERIEANKNVQMMIGPRSQIMAIQFAMLASDQNFQAYLNELAGLNAQIAALNKVTIGSWSGSSASSNSTNKYLKEQAALDEVNTQLERNAKAREVAEGEGWTTLSQKRIDLYTQEKKAIGYLMEAKKKELATVKQGTKDYYELKNTINDLYIDWLAADNEIVNLQEEITDNYKDLMQERMDAAEKAKDEAIDAINDEYDAYIDAQNKRLDALDREQELTSRSRDLEDYEAKRQALLEERHYHEIRSGQEHIDAIADIDQQLVDLELEMARQKEDWQTEDEKSAIEDRIEQYEDERDQKIDIIEDAWNKVEEIFSEANYEMLEKMGFFTQEMFAIYDQNFFKPLAAAFNTLNYDALSNISSLSGFSSAGISSSLTGPSGLYTGGATNTSYYINAANQDKASGSAAGGMTKDYYLSHPNVFTDEEKLYFDTLFDLPSANTGGYTLKQGLYELHPGELITNPELTKQLMAFLKPYSSGNTASTSTDNSRRVSVEKAVNIENAYFYDESDESSLGREVARRILTVGRS